uniref:Zinc finger, CCHC-type n=1 Tax=Tanacetum cinerariifolium TaxID=118510 RepID=A0A699IHF8_TANCI|nr:zinc finger, CCHC-type [Tanacetum cinerariifolium]
MASMNTRLNIEKLYENIVQKHRGSKQVGIKKLGSKQVGFKQLSPGVETGFYGVHDEKLDQRRLVDKQPEEKTNTDCLVKEHEKKYHTGWKIKTGNILDSCNQRSTQQCMKSEVAKHLVWSIQGFLERGYNQVYILLAIGFKKPIDMLGFFGWLSSIKQGMLEPVKVKCIFLGYYKCIVGNKRWRLDGVTTKVLRGFEFEVEPLGDHKFEVEPLGNVDQRAGLQEVQTKDLMDYQLARDREQHIAHELFGYREDSNKAVFAVAAVEKIFVHESLTFNNTVASEATKGLLDKAKGNVLGIEIVRDQSGNTLRVSQSRCYNGKLVQTLLEGHSILSLEGSLSRDYDVEKNDKFDRGLQTDVQVFVDFDYAMGRSITIMESRYELRLVAGIATGSLVKGGSLSEVPAQVEVATYWY